METADGRRELWAAEAGEQPNTPRRQYRPDGATTKNEPHPAYTPRSHLNDAEAHLIRAAQKEGATIKAMGATREMCPICQQAAAAAGVLDTAVTPLEKTSP